MEEFDNLNHDSTTGLIEQASYTPSPNCDDRPSNAVPEAIIIHSISLPPGEYGNNNVVDFFCNQLNSEQHPYFAEIGHLTVSAHFFIQRDGRLNQFVPTHRRAWHAGESMCLGKPVVNNFSIGVELEGLDSGTDGYTEAQYQTLRMLVESLQVAYPTIKDSNLFAHSDIAPDRKIDPGPYFNWTKVI
jgi:N-acetyl-anhydromuramoyl-L-alanine amidase